MKKGPPGKPECAVIRVSDTGPGIPAHLLDKIFDPFFTMRKGGMGLGLAISREIIEEHGGYIFVESTVNCGATFIIHIPSCAGSNYPNKSSSDAYSSAG
jgi:signal transduction histidine kinase